jgi:photosystem II stability/assembly factor-like uncharacterized protein
MAQRGVGIRAARVAFTVRLLLVVAVVPAAASAQQWTQLSAPGGWIRRLAVAPTDPATVYAGTNIGGLYRSTDSGGNWTRTAVAEIGRDSVHAVAIDPANKAVVYAGTDTKGIFKTIDGGAHWAPINTGVPAPNSRLIPIKAIAVDPDNAAVLLAGGGNFSSGGAANLLLSTNGGQSWAPVTAPGLADVPIYDVAFAAGSAFAATEGHGVLWSGDNETTWAHLGDDKIDFISVDSVAVDQSVSPMKVVAGTDDGIWVIPYVPPAPPVPPASVSASDANADAHWAENFVEDIVYTVYLTETAISYAYGGEQQKPAPLGALSTFTNPVYYVGSLDQGVFRSTDRGATKWKSARHGLAPYEIDALEVAAGDPYALYGGADGAGVWHSDDGGENWHWASRGLLAASFDGIAVDPSDPATVYAGSEGGGVLKSVDGGATWGMVGFSTMIYDRFDPFVRILVIDPNATSTLYAVTDEGVFKSSNGGAAWSRLSLPGGFYPRTMIATGSGATTLWLGGSPGVLRSTTGGASWTKPDPTFQQSVQALAVSRTAPQTLYAGTTNNGIWKTTNEGTSWGNVNNDGGSGFLKFGSVPTLAVDPTSVDIVYAGVDGRAVWKTIDGGANWVNQKEGLFDDVDFVYASLSAIVINSAHPNTLFAGATSASAFGATFRGAFRSNDGGAHWAKFGNGLEGLSVASMIFDPTNNNRLYAGTQGAGLFRYGPAATRTFEVRDRLRRGH